MIQIPHKLPRRSAEIISSLTHWDLMLTIAAAALVRLLASGIRLAQ